MNTQNTGEIRPTLRAASEIVDSIVADLGFLLPSGADTRITLPYFKFSELLERVAHETECANTTYAGLTVVDLEKAL